MKNLQFAKMVASGNDFIVIDARVASCRVPESGLRALARAACDRKYGIGADGLLVLERSKKTNFRMRIFNPDGSEPGMCGNGARCAALFSRLAAPKFETKAGRLEAKVASPDKVKLKLTDPGDLWKNIDLNLGGNFIKVHYINTGVPHAVFFTGNIDGIDVQAIGRKIRLHKQFQPEGVNVNFAQPVSKDTIKVRTYERGVEAETLACGTGSTATALLAHHTGVTKKSPVSIQTQGGEILKVYFDYAKNKFSNVWLEGSAKMICEGRFYV